VVDVVLGFTRRLSVGILDGRVIRYVSSTIEGEILPEE
jgi:hypothetical protein